MSELFEWVYLPFMDGHHHICFLFSKLMLTLRISQYIFISIFMYSLHKVHKMNA